MGCVCARPAPTPLYDAGERAWLRSHIAEHRLQLRLLSREVAELERQLRALQRKEP